MQFSPLLFVKENDMNNVRLLVAGLLAASALAFSPVAQAQMTGQWYAGVGFGQSKAKDACSGAAAAGVTSCDDSDTAARIFGGYKFNSNIAAEVGYSDLGKVKASGVVLGLPASAEWKATVWDFSAVGMLPINNQFSVLGRLGVTSWSIDLNLNVSGVPGSESASGTDMTYGLGVQWDINNQFGLRAEWQQYSSLGDDATTGQSDVEVIGVSALMKF